MTAEDDLCHMVTMILCFVMCFVLPIITTIKNTSVLYAIAILICLIYLVTLCIVLYCVCNCAPNNNNPLDAEESLDLPTDAIVIIINPSNNIQVGTESKINL